MSKTTPTVPAEADAGKSETSAPAKTHPSPGGTVQGADSSKSETTIQAAQQASEEKPGAPENVTEGAEDPSSTSSESSKELKRKKETPPALIASVYFKPLTETVLVSLGSEDEEDVLVGPVAAGRGEIQSAIEQLLKEYPAKNEQFHADQDVIKKARAEKEKEDKAKKSASPSSNTPVRGRRAGRKGQANPGSAAAEPGKGQDQPAQVTFTETPVPAPASQQQPSFNF